MIKISYRGYRFPPEIIQQAIWLYVRFTLSFRDVEDLLAERGILVSYETVRRWVNHFGPMIVADLRKRRQKPHMTWHLDEVYLKIDGRLVYLWRAVDAEGEVLDVLVQTRRNRRAALKLMRKLLKKYGFVPDKLVKDDLRSLQCSGAGSWDRKTPRAWPMAQQSSGEFASANPTKGEEDARVQERGIRAKISLNPRSHLQHIQRPTPSHLSKNTPSLQGVGRAWLPRSRILFLGTSVALWFATRLEIGRGFHRIRAARGLLRRRSGRRQEPVSIRPHSSNFNVFYSYAYGYSHEVQL